MQSSIHGKKNECYRNAERKHSDAVNRFQWRFFFFFSFFFSSKRGDRRSSRFWKKKRKMLLQQSEQKPVYRGKNSAAPFSKKGKKIALPSQSKKNEDKKYYVETFQFNLPEVLTDHFFFRHRLTLPVVRRFFLEVKKISHLWALALYKRWKSPPLQSVRVS